MFFLRGLMIGVVGCMVAGCAGYRMGPTNGLEARARSVQVNPIRNETFEPRLGQAVTHALRKRLQQEGTYRLATQGDGDVVVNGTIVRYDRRSVSYNPADVITTRDFEVYIYVHVVAEDRRAGKIVLDREVRGRTTLRVGDDQASAERQARPVLADDVANNIAALLVDGDWE